MDLVPKYLNELADADRGKRLSAYRKLSDLRERGALTDSDEFALIRCCLRGFEDAAERCRENAVLIVTSALPGQNSNILDWVLPAVVTRIGVSPVAEKSEELRLLLLKLAILCMETFPHDIGPRNYIDFFQVLIENCLSDAFPELKKEACRASVRLCEIEPVQVKHIALPLAKVVKGCLLHKHGVVRAEAVRTLASLIQHGAAEVLQDGKDEPENKTTAVILYVLANDHVEAVRLAVVQLLSTALLDILDRQEHHRKLLPHLLLLMTDRFHAVSSTAIGVMENMGRLYLLDNEDNTIDITKRRVTMKDIEWYGDDGEYMEMALATVDKNMYPILQKRPSLGARYVVAESLRGFIQRVLDDVTAIDWVIPFSSNNKRVMALRILWMCIYHSEKCVVQFVQQILGVLYRSLREDNQDVVKESHICLEILGKFLTPEQYLPFLTTKGDVKHVEDETPVVVQSRTKMVVVSSANRDAPPAPTIFSTAAVSIKCSILESFCYLMKGSKHLLSASQATQIVKAMTSSDVLESDSEAILSSLLDTLEVLVHILGERGFIPTTSNPLPPDVREDSSQRTLDSILFYALLCLSSSEFPTVQARVSSCTKILSLVVTGEVDGIYDLHIGRILFRHGTQMPVNAFANLVLNSKNIKSYTEQLCSIFLVKLSNIDFSRSVTEELRYLRVLEELLWRDVPVFSGPQLEELLRGVILPLGAFRPGCATHLFRKVAIGCLCAAFGDQHRNLLDAAFAENRFALSSKSVTTWCSASDADDAELRLVCITNAPNICCLPVNIGSANDIVQSILLRFDDSNDVLRSKAASSLLKILESKGSVCAVVIDQIIAQIVPLVKKILVHLDDSEETVGLRPILVSVLKEMSVFAPSVTADLVRGALARHQVTSYCEEVLCYIDLL